MKFSMMLMSLVLSVVLMACGGSDESGGGEAGAGSGGETSDSSASGAGGGDMPSVEFDESALSAAPLEVVHLQINEGGAPAPASSVTPVIDTCEALSSADLDAIADAAAADYSLGETHDFEATTMGAVCQYRSDTHVVSVVVGPVDEVSADPDSPALSLPLGAGGVSATQWADDSSVTILSEDSFGIDTPFAAVTASGDYGVMVRNSGGTGIDYSIEGLLFAEIAAAASAGAADAPGPSADVVEQAEVVVADACSVWSVEELDAFLVDHVVEADDMVTQSDGCVWSSSERAEIVLDTLAQDEEIDPGFTPLEPGSEVLVSEFGDWIYLKTDDAAVRVRVTVPPDPETNSSVSGRDAGIALVRNLEARLG